MERKSQEPTLMDAVIQDIGAPRMTARLNRLDQVAPWWTPLSSKPRVARHARMA